MDSSRVIERVYSADWSGRGWDGGGQLWWESLDLECSKWRHEPSTCWSW